ncbi:conserved membrane hypothetical protein [Burkholderiales bacterium 8X]|nr:conserved membrane hypothetical protein [Burkholderiales bacterium 8X]
MQSSGAALALALRRGRVNVNLSDAALLPSMQILSAIAWIYLVTNAVRVVTYLPQIVAVWRCRDGAKAISLLTWGSWVLSHVTGVVYGIWVIHDGFFIVISTINLAGCAAVTMIAAQRRGLLPWLDARASTAPRIGDPMARSDAMPAIAMPSVAAGFPRVPVLRSASLPPLHPAPPHRHLARHEPSGKPYTPHAMQ